MKSIFNRNFILLWSGSIISKTGDAVNEMAIAIWILTQTNSPLLMGLMYIFPKITKTIFVIFAGNYVDKQNKKSILVITDFIRGIIAILIAGVIFITIDFWFKIAFFYLLLTFSSICDSLFQPASQAILPEIVSKKNLANTNAVFHVTDNFISIFGILIASSFVIFIGVVPAIIFNGFSFIFSAVLEMFLRYKYNQTGKLNYKKMLFMIKEGLNYLYNEKFIFVILITAGALNFLFVPVFQNILQFALKEATTVINFPNTLFLKTSKNSLAALLTIYALSSAIGSIIGGIILSIKKTNTSKFNSLFKLTILISSIVNAMLGILLIPEVYNKLSVFIFVLCLSLISIINGICLSAFGVSLITLIQTHVKSEFLGRVFSFRILLSGILNPFGMLIISIIANSFRIYFIYFIIDSIYSFIIFLILSQQIKKYSLIGTNIS